MRHPKEADVMELRRQGKTFGEIAQLTSVARSTVGDILKGVPRPRPAGRKSEMTIKGTGDKWAVEINPWVRLIHEAAVDQIPRCKDMSLADFIYEDACFVRDIFELKPPGWATVIPAPLKFSTPPDVNQG